MTGRLQEDDSPTPPGETSPISGPVWSPVLSPGRARKSQAVACEVAARLRDRRRVVTAADAAVAQTAFPRSVRWEPSCLAQGDCGLALMAAYLDACLPDQGWDRVGHGYLSEATRAAEALSGKVPVSLFGGLSGVSFAAWQLSRAGTRYRRLLTAAEDVLLPQGVAMAATLSRQVATGAGLDVSQFDVISGLAGVGAYLLCRAEEPAVSLTLRLVLSSLVGMVLRDAVPPAWHTPQHLMWDDDLARHYPQGNLNCGLAHGIPGPLALLALAYSDGILVPGLPEAVERIADWLLAHRVYDRWGPNWPTAVDAVGRGDDSTARAPQESPSRAAWCYGSPGVSRALWLAGRALHAPAVCDAAVEAMQAVFRRPLPQRRIDSPTFCHGVAGLLQVTLRFAADTGSPFFTDAADDLIDQLLSQYEPDSLLGYRNLEPGAVAVDQPGLLDGAPGVALVLLAAASPVEPTWDRAFLLS